MNDDFVARLGVQLREAALREERRGSLARRLAALRYEMPRAGALAAGALATMLVAAVVAVGGLDWGEKDTVTTPRVVETFGLADNLGTMGTGFGAVWAIDAAEGRVLRVDPGSHDVGARIPVSPDAILNVGAGAVWVLEPTNDQPPRGRLLRIDPSTNRITARVALNPPGGGGFTPFDVLIVQGTPWVVGPDGALRIDVETGRVAQFVAVDQADGDPFPFAVTVADDGVWVLTRDQRIVRYDLDSGRRAQELPARLPGAEGLTPTPAGPVLGTSSGELARVNPRDGRVEWQRTLKLSFMPVVEGDALWAHATGGGGRDRLVVLDLATGETRSSTPLPEFGIAGSTLVGRQIWLASPAGKLMVLQR
jgi:hypothetical protein